MLRKEIDEYGGTLLIMEPPVVLPDAVRQAFLKKWEGANEDGELDELLERAAAAASPKAYLLPAFVAEKDDVGVYLTVPFGKNDDTPTHGVRMDSPLLAEKLEKNTRVIATLSTCGMELHEIAMAERSDPLLFGALDELCLVYLQQLRSVLRDYVEETITGNDKFSSLNPGSLNTWPVTGQKDLFALLGKGAEGCGVTLTPSSLMIPFKSSSGLFFPTEIRFESCMRCPRITCPGRRAPYEGTRKTE